MASQTEFRLPDVTDPVPAQEPARSHRILRIRVVNTDKSDRPAVNIKVPIGVVKFGVEMAQAFAPEVRRADLDWDAITAMIDEGDLGKIVEVEDEAEHKTIEVWVE